MNFATVAHTPGKTLLANPGKFLLKPIGATMVITSV